MLKDRRVLIEKELKKAHDEAAQMYWNIVVSEASGDTVEYQAMRDKISKLEFDLNAVDLLIHKGHE